MKNLKKILHHLYFDLNIRSKLRVLVILPLSVIFLLSIGQVYIYFQQHQMATKSVGSVNLALKIANFIYELQKERGVTAGFVGSNGTQLQQSLIQQRKYTDRAYKQYEDFSKYIVTKYARELNEQSHFISYRSQIADIKADFKKMIDIRQGVDLLQPQQSFQFYSTLIAKLVRLVNLMQTQRYGEYKVTLNSEFNTLLVLQERAGQERGALNGVRNDKDSPNMNLLKHVSFLGKQQSSLIDDFRAIADPEHLLWIEQTLTDPVVNEVHFIRKNLNEYIERRELIDKVMKIINYAGFMRQYALIADNFRQEQLIDYQQKAKVVGRKLTEFLAASTLAIEDQQAFFVIYEGIVAKGKILARPNPPVYGEQSLEILKAFESLNHTPLTLDNDYWWQVATQRIDLFHGVSQRIAASMQRNAMQQERNAFVVMTIVIAVFCISSIFLFYATRIVKRRLVGEVNNIAEAMNKMVEDHRFNQKLNIEGKDELGKMAQAYNRMLDTRNEFEAQWKVSSEVFEHASEAIVITNADNNIENVNPAFTRITGYSKEEAIGKNPAILKSGRHDDEFYKSMWEHLNTRGTWQGEIWNRRKSGEVYPEFLSISMVKNSAGEVVQHISLFSDISHHKEYEQDLWQQANFDALTNLPNRSYFLEHLKLNIERSKRDQAKLAVVFIDLDRFKYINDTLGHTAGDELLVLVGERISRNIRRVDMLARLGGDEFVVLIPDVEQVGETERVIEVIRNCVQEPFNLSADHESRLSASLGISVYPDDGEDADTLIKSADLAMYQAKSSGRNAFKFFTEELTSTVLQKMELEQELRVAIANKDFCLHYQPVFSLSNGEIVGAEALIRWQHPEKGLIFPDAFIEMAEETHLIGELGAWVIEQALLDLKHWQSVGLTLHVAVNASSRQTQLPTTIKEALETYQVDAQHFKLEITESLLMDNSESTVNSLQAIRDLGVEIYMDDFGTGYSSLSYLKQFPIDVLKIDRSFVMNCTEVPSDATIVEGIIKIAKSLNLQLVGEGIEHQKQYQLLADAGCDFGQGYLISKPIPNSEFVQFVKNYNPKNH